MKDAKTSKVGDQSLSMPICAVLQIALVELLSTWGIEPSAITSHSSGEIASAFAAGVLSKRSAIGIAYARGQFIPEAEGRMIAVGLSQEDCREYIARVPSDSGKLAVACVNSPTSTTLSGDAPAITEIQQFLQKDGVFVRLLRVSTAYHSHHISPFASAYESWIRDNVDLQVSESWASKYTDLSIVFSSPTTGRRVTSPNTLLDASHWARSLSNTVQFMDAIRTAMCEPQDDPPWAIDFIIEIGPHSALGGPIREIMSLQGLAESKVPYSSCLVRDTDATNTMHSLVVALLRCGYPVDMGAVNLPGKERSAKVITNLPHYPWNHQVRHWYEPRQSKEYRHRTEAPHDLIGSLDPACNPSRPVWRNTIRASDLPWVRDHIVQGDMVYPGAGLICSKSSSRPWRCMNDLL